MTGPVMLSGHPDYDGARKIWNGMHDKRPALIARCQNTEDVCHAVDFARERSLLVAVRGGGHSWPGKSTCDDGMMLDLADMKNIDVDVAGQTAWCQGGALLGHLDDATLEHGLVTTAGVVSHTGVGGFTLGGGFGRLNRKYGLTIDNVLGAEIVTADGTVRHISADNEPDLFWAIRGGGGNFGVVSKFHFQLHPMDRNVLSGMLVWPVEQARDVLAFYAEWSPTVSRELYVGPVMATMPDGTGIVAMEVVYNGDPAAGEKELAPMRAIGTMIDDGVKLQDYKVLQTHEDATVAHGIRSYAKNGMVKEFTQALVNDMIDAYIPDPRAAIFTHTAGGAVKDHGELDTAFPHRNAESMIVYFTGWADPAQDEEGKAMCKQDDQGTIRCGQPVQDEQQHQAWLATAREPQLPPRFINNDRSRIREIQAAAVFLHRQPQSSTGRYGFQHLLWQAPRLGPEKERIALFVVRYRPEYSMRRAGGLPASPGTPRATHVSQRGQTPDSPVRPV
jgi:FAD/FMN-containing dehydrogenase